MTPTLYALECCDPAVDLPVQIIFAPTDPAAAQTKEQLIDAVVERLPQSLSMLRICLVDFSLHWPALFAAEDHLMFLVSALASTGQYTTDVAAVGPCQHVIRLGDVEAAVATRGLPDGMPLPRAKVTAIVDALTRRGSRFARAPR